MKKKIALLLACIMMLSFLTACGNTEEESDGKNIPELKIMFSLSGEAENAGLQEAVEKVLKESFSTSGYTVEKITITTSDSGEDCVKNVESGEVDIAWITDDDYCQYGKTIAPLVGSTVDTSSKLALHAMICTVNSDKGMTLRDKGLSDASSITWDDLNDAKWGIVKAENSIGTQYADVWMQNAYGKKLTDLSNLTIYEDTISLLQAAAEKSIDMMAFLYDERTNYAAAWTAPKDEDVTLTNDLKGVVKGFGASEAVHISMKQLFKSESYYPYLAITKMGSNLDNTEFRKAFCTAMDSVQKKCSDVVPSSVVSKPIVVETTGMEATLKWYSLYGNK